MTWRSIPTLCRNPIFRPFTSTTRRAEISSPVDSVRCWRSEPVAMEAAFAGMKWTLLRNLSADGVDQVLTENVELDARLSFDHTSETRDARMGVDDAFLQPGQREFFLAVANDPAMRDLVHVSRLDVGTQMAAISVGLKHRGCYYLILSSYTSAALSRFGPGRAQLKELLRHAIQQRLQWFDFTVGDEPYKRDWSDTELPLHDHLAAVTLRGWLFVAMLAVFRRIKRH